MKVGIPKEIKNHEYRVAITPAGVLELVRHGHEVVIEQDAGLGSSIPNEDYVAAGATILATADEVWGSAEMILKVKEPIAAEYHRMREGQVLFTYLHLAADRPLTEELVKRRVTAIAYETVELADRSLPLLAPMSEVAGRLAPQVGANALMRAQGGRGVLMGGVSGVYAAKVVVIGAGVAGQNAATIALGMQAEVLLLDNNIARLRQMDAIYQGHMQTIASNTYEIERAVRRRRHGHRCRPRARGQGAEARHQRAGLAHEAGLGPRRHRDRPGRLLRGLEADHARGPTYAVHDSVFYCVANMPGAVPNTSTYALTNVTLPYAVSLANRGWRGALQADHALALGLNVHDGQVTYGAVAEAFDMPLTVSLERCSPDFRRGRSASPATSITSRSSVACRPTPSRRTGATWPGTSSGAPTTGGTAIDTITENDVSDFAASLRQPDPRAPDAGCRQRGIAWWSPCERSTGSWRARGLTTVDPARHVRPSAIPRRLPKALPYDDVRALIESAGDLETPEGLRDRALVEFLVRDRHARLGGRRPGRGRRRPRRADGGRHRQGETSSACCRSAVSRHRRCPRTSSGGPSCACRTRPRDAPAVPQLAGSSALTAERVRGRCRPPRRARA